VRSRCAWGGAIFAGKTENSDLYVVVADHTLLPDSSLVDRAQVWSVAGEAQAVSYRVDGVERSEMQVKPTHLEMQRPSGKNLVAWIAESSDCRGIGEVRARRLWERFGMDLPNLIEAAEVEPLAEVVGAESAQALIAAFEKHGVVQALLWLDQMGLQRALSASVVRYWGKDVRQKVQANPYALVSFCADWTTVDNLALRRFGIEPDDSRRLVAAVEEVLYRAMDRGDTAVAGVVIRAGLRKILGDSDRAERAVVTAITEGRVLNADGLLQTQGLARIEEAVTTRLTGMLGGLTQRHAEMFPVDLPDATVVQASVALYESMYGLELTPEQRQAVFTSSTSRVSLILGGAGTGKTTVLKALCHVIDRFTQGAFIYQVALAGRAAQRMTEATGRQSKTIAAFLLDETIAPGSTVLIDEVSMVDVILMYRVLRHLPDGVRLVLIGDPAQLPPIGPGLVLHTLAGHPAIPQTTLLTVMRQAENSGIPLVAAAVRAHLVPLWKPYGGKGAGVSVVACSDAAIDSKVAEIYQELGGTGLDYSVQVLSSTRNGYGGVRALNTLLHSRNAPMGQPICHYHEEFGLVSEISADHLNLFVGDLVIFGSNDYALGLRNGSLGRIIQALEPVGPESCVCIVEFDETSYSLTAAQLRYVTHAYAVTIHKAQGSQFKRVIIPVRLTKLLDNSLLYTAITRAVEQVVIVGDIAAAEQAIVSPSSSSMRTTRMSALLQLP
jgi:exodeoxyribonuclease V alpha subunit